MHFIPPLFAATIPDALTFAIAALIVLAGGIGVVASRSPVHSALSLVMCLFGIAVLFVAQDADFLAAVQIIVYAGAIVVLFLFVIMLLGVDKLERIRHDPLRAQRPLAVLLAILSLAGLLFMGVTAKWAVGARSVSGRAYSHTSSEVVLLGRSIFTTFLLPFEATAALLVIAVIGAVILVRSPSRSAGSSSSDDGNALTVPPELSGERASDNALEGSSSSSHREDDLSSEGIVKEPIGAGATAGKGGQNRSREDAQ